MAFISVRDLDVFRLSYQTALDIHRSMEAMPKHELYGGVVDQLRRSSKSVCANLAEGLGKGSTEIEECRFLRIAIGSIEESRVWLMFCLDLKYLEEEAYRDFDERCDRIGKMLMGLLKLRKHAA